ncbi:tRNA-dihydrouridine synthase 1 [Enteropsectra breve]|nr:tRNA-dihydrouridine synthase 1 [Enteropsectra breve]
MSRDNRIFDYLATKQKPWKILAPMVGNSDEAYRKLAMKYGADLCYTEMVNSKVYNRGKTNPQNNKWYTTRMEERPLVIQICGDNPSEMLKTCKAIESHCDAIDINFGCPQDIARRGHYGSWLQDEWELIQEIVSTLSQNISVPLFCKIRIFDSIEKTVEYAKMFEKCGCSLLAVHGRTREQKGISSGLASWEHIRAVKEALSIPVIANGNMIYHSDIKRCVEATAADGVMIAEPHLYDPMIFVEESKRSVDIFKEYLEIIKDNGEVAEYKNVKSHAFKILRGILVPSEEMRVKLDKCGSIDEFSTFVDDVYKKIEINEISQEELELRPYLR